MDRSPLDTVEKIFSTCRRALGSKTWGRVLAAMDEEATAQSFPDRLDPLIEPMDLPGYIADLARLEWALYKQAAVDDPHRRIQAVTVNPTLTIVPVRWKNLAAFIRSNATGAAPLNEPAHVIVWRHPESKQLHYRQARNIDLLALKLIVEQIDPKEAASLGKVTPGDIQTAIDRAVSQGFLLSPDSRIRRKTPPAEKINPALASFQSAEIFTLQWHVTQACDLDCLHCYDRSDRVALAVDTAMAILDDFYDFCRRMHVRGQITFTGGNPLLYPHFDDVYRAASQFGFGIAILGNPTPLDRVRQLLEIDRPLYFQISLEGLEANNDAIRGEGHFARSLAFLEGLRDLDIFSMVMLTLTRDNLADVLPLATLLEDRADAFTFNRLSTVGKGANLLMPQKAAFESFIRAYDAAAANNPQIGLKDNLINIVRQEKKAALFGGCTGHGCGAAFNFLALLADGEVHACRKFPSLLGNITQNSLYDIYRSDLAERYRTGPRACRSCRLNPVCRGCLAIGFSLGLDIFEEKDPFCFASQEVTGA